MCRQYTADEALEMGWINTVVPVADLEKETVAWAKEMLQKVQLRFVLLKQLSMQIQTV